MLLLLGFAFVSGLVTILAPCIWPLLPIILSSSIAGEDHKRPLGITLGIMLSFAIFTLSISYLVSLFNIDPDILRFVAVIVIGFLGLSMLFPQLGTLTEIFVSRLSGRFGSTTKRAGFMGGFITGLSLGIVWAPCAGPILASVAALAATGQVTVTLIFITAAYVTGVGIPLFFFAYAGQQFVNRTRFLSAYTGRVQQVFGVIMLLTALAIYTNYDRLIQVKLLDLFPQYSSALTRFESSDSVKQQLDMLKGRKEEMQQNTGENYGQAPEFVGIAKWLNLPAGRQGTEKPLTMKELRGKVVLVDFWTYTCINCIRTLPFVTSWYDKYKDKGLVVVGVHTPEFAFEKKTENVEQAIKQYNIHYPVAQDNDYDTWNAFNNQYWPAKYLVDAKGVIRYQHFGEGQYEETEKMIQELLKEAGNTVRDDMVDMPDRSPRVRTSPETYLGAERMEYLYPNGSTTRGKQTFTLATDIPQSTFSFGGEWTIGAEEAVAGKNAQLTYHFYAKRVFLVLRPPEDKTGTIKVYLDGKLIEKGSAGVDVKDGSITIDTDRLYTLIDLPGEPSSHILRLEFSEGIAAYAFTFG